MINSKICYMQITLYLICLFCIFNVDATLNSNNKSISQSFVKNTSKAVIQDNTQQDLFQTEKLSFASDQDQTQNTNDNKNTSDRKAIKNVTNSHDCEQPLLIKNPMNNPMISSMNNVLKSVVYINVNESEAQNSIGTGFILDKNGLIVTNNHIVGDNQNIQVILYNDKVFDAHVIGRDELYDIALLQILSLDEDLVAVKLGDSDQINIGDNVFAIGSPFGFKGTVTSGIVSYNNRNISNGLQDNENVTCYIQTDASINLGNSGGPLFLYDGTVIGVISMLFSYNNTNMGVNFALPSNKLQDVIDQLKTFKKVKKVWIGFNVSMIDYGAFKILSKEIPQEILKDFTMHSLALINDIEVNSPIYNAGVRLHDILLSINDNIISSKQEFYKEINLLKADCKVRVKILRDKRIIECEFTCVSKDDTDIDVDNLKAKFHSTHIENIGCYITDYNEKSKDFFNLQDLQCSAGVVVTQSDKDSDGGLNVGDVICKVNHNNVSNVSDFVGCMNDIKLDTKIALLCYDNKSRVASYKAIDYRKHENNLKSNNHIVKSY